MRTVSEFPHRVREIEHAWIPMPDGCRLGARIWLPEAAESSPVPALLEYIPYRKRDGTRWRDEPMHRYFAGHGYAAVRVDLRGTGESEGLLRDEYLEQEQDDGLAVIRWLASQPWCTGRVGMMGISWGGFNALQIAARRPPALAAVLTVCSSDDRYTDDAHFMGGCLLNENLIWGSVLFTINAQPPDPELVGERWREMWMARLENNPLFPEIWLRHQRRDAYWERGSVGEDLSRIACPVYAVGGWADGYTNAVPRLLAGLTGPRKGLVGPWAHVYPHEGVPKPAIGFLQEALRWWDHWLKGIETGIMDEPVYRVWMQDSVQPKSFYEERPGRWVAEPSWPSDRIEMAPYELGSGGRLRRSEGSERDVQAVSIASPLSVGLDAGSWCGFGIEGEMPGDQREDDGRSLCFDSEPLDGPLEILGAPVAVLNLSVAGTQGFVVVRLNDVAPHGASTRVTYGLLNLTHRSGHDRPEPLVPGETYQVTVKLNDVAHSFAAGRRLRVSISTSYWPLVWPSPERVSLSVLTGRSRLELPVRPPREGDEALPPFEPPEGGPPLDATELSPGGVERLIRHDPATGEIEHVTSMDADDSGGIAFSRIESIALEVGHAILERFRMREGDPLSATAEIEQKAASRRGDWSTRVETRTRLSAGADRFRLEAELHAYEGEARIFARSWDRTIPRDGL